MYESVLSTVNGRERRWRPANSLPHRMSASSLPEPPAGPVQKFMNSSNSLQKSDLISASHFPRSKLLCIPKECSHCPSLMARGFPLGPSDAPWPVETSTAHGEPSFSESNLTMENINFYGGIVLISANDHSRISSNQSSPEMNSLLEASPPVLIRRRFILQTWQTTLLLGFWLEGLTHNLGPLTSLQPKSIRYDPTPNVKNPRSDPITLLLSPKQCLCRFLYLADRRLQMRKKPYSLLWACNTFMRILVLVSSMVTTWSPSSTSLRLLTVTILSSLQPSRTMINCSRQTSRSLFRFPLLSDFESLRRPSSPVMKRISLPHSFFMEKNQERILAILSCLVPATHEAKTHLSTSQNLMIVTISKVPELFSEVSLTHHVLACGLLLSSFGLRVSMDLSYLINVVSFCSVFLLYPTMYWENFVSFGLME